MFCDIYRVPLICFINALTNNVTKDLSDRFLGKFGSSSGALRAPFFLVLHITYLVQKFVKWMQIC